MSSSPNCKCPNMIPFHLPYKIPRTEGQKCSKSNQQQDRYTDFWPTSKLWQWKFTVRRRHLGTMRQGRTNLKEKSSGSATGRGANLTSIWEGSGHTLLVFAATARNTYAMPSGTPRHPNWLQHQVGQTPNQIILPSPPVYKHSYEHYACRFCWMLLQSCPMRLTALKGNISLAKSRKMQSFHTAILHLTSLLLGYFNIFYFCLYQQTLNK